MALTVNTSAGFPENLGGTLVNVTSGVADEIFIYNDGGNLWKRVFDSGLKVYKTSWLKTSTAPVDLTARFNTMVADARVEIVEVDVDLNILGVVNCQGKKVCFKGGKFTGGTGVVNNIVVDADMNTQCFEPSISLTNAKTTDRKISAKWWGATGSGTVNDQPAIQKAIDTVVANDKLARTIFFPSGTYRIDAPLIVYKWNGVDYQFVSVNLEGQEASHFTSTAQDAIIYANFTDTFALGFQRCRSSIIKGLVFQGLFNKSTSNLTDYYEGNYATWAAGVRDSQYSPYSAFVVDPFRNINTLPPDGGYPGLSSYYRGTGTNGGSSGLMINQCRINGFTVGILVSPNFQTFNAENFYVDEVSVENCKVAYATCQRQEKNNHVKNLISWDRVHTIIDGVTYGQQQGCPPNIDGMNLAGNIVRIFNVSAQFNISFKNIFGEQVYRIGNLFGGAGIITVEACYVDLLNTVPSVFPSEHIACMNTQFVGCTFRYYDDLFNKRLYVADGRGSMFKNCWFDNLPINTNLETQSGWVDFENCRTQTALIGPNSYRGFAFSRDIDIIPTRDVKIEIDTFPDEFIKEWRLELKAGNPCYNFIYNTGATTFTLNTSNRTAVITGNFYPTFAGFGTEYVMAYNVTQSKYMVVGRVLSGDGGTGAITVGEVPMNIAATDTLINYSSARIKKLRASILYNSNASSALSAVNSDFWGTSNWTGGEISQATVLNSSFNLIGNAGATGNDLYQPGWGQPGDGSMKEVIVATLTPDEYSSIISPTFNKMMKTDTIWIAKGAVFGSNDVDKVFKFTTAGFLNAPAIGQSRQAVWEEVLLNNVTIASPANNRVITSDGTATGLNAEIGLTYNGTTLGVTGAISASGGTSGAALIKAAKTTTGNIAEFSSTTAGNQLTIDDVISGVIYAVNDVSGLPIIEANSAWDVTIYDFPNIIFRKQGNKITITRLNLSNISTFADDTAAGVGGLLAGDVYKTATGELRIKL